MQPKVSLILTTYNSEELLPTTLASVENQDYENIEVVIKDGGSTDRSLEIIDEFEKKHNHLGNSSDNISVITASASDTGIYDAMNQGIKLSTGDIIVCFNDTFLTKNAISKYVSALEAECIDGSKYDAVHSDLVYSEGERVIRTWHMGPGDTRDLNRGWMPGHPTLFLRREVYEKYGYYKTDYRIAADYEYMVRILRDGSLKLNYIPENLISMYYGGTSSSSLSSYIKSFNEGWRALRENGFGFLRGLLITIRRTFKVLRQF